MLLATDLDGTFLGGRQSDRLRLYRLIREEEKIQLLFVTGRGLESVMPLLANPVIPNPDYIICDVGATVIDGQTLEPVQPLQSEIERGWPGIIEIKRKFKKIRGLKLQQVSRERRCSYFFDETTDLEGVKKIADELGLDVLLSAGKFLDILPKDVNKGSTLRKLAALKDFPEDEILVAGDTLNDRSLYDTQYKGVVVADAEEGLLSYTKHMDNVHHAEARGAGGILESMEHFPDFQPLVKGDKKNRTRNQTGDTQLLLLYHRFPYEVREENGVHKRVAPKSPNGIIPSILGFFNNGRHGSWIAWEEVKNNQKIAPADRLLDPERYPNLIASPVLLTKREIEVFYKLFSKEAFWPVIFSFADKVKFNHSYWEQYVEVNRQFAEKAAAEADSGATVWIHEYNLWMVPGILRQLRPDVKIGFFHHTSFPPADIFNIIPWRKEIIGSMLQCDYIGFHIPRYVENFVDVLKSHAPVKVISRQPCGERFLTYSCALGVDTMTREIDVSGKRVRLGAHPVGVDMNNIRTIFQQPATRQQIHALKGKVKGKKIVLSVERLDYVKGPLEKIYAYQSFLEQHPEYHGKVELINICTPPASGMKIYDKVLLELEQAIGRINGKYARMDWVPIRFFFRSVPFEEVITYYAIADIAWITPLRDGLNLVAKEYVAVQGLTKEKDGVLIVSEFAGVSVELPYAIRTNPYDTRELVHGLEQAFSLEPEDRRLRMERLFEVVDYYDIDEWSSGFIRELEDTAENSGIPAVH